MDNPQVSAMQKDYKDAVDKWIAAIRTEEALASGVFGQSSRIGDRIEMLLQRIAAPDKVPRQLVLRGELVVRGSSS